MFNLDYCKFKPYMIEGATLFIEGKSQARRWDPNDFEFSIKRIDFLSNIREKLAKNFEIKVDLAKIDTHFIDQLFVVFEENPGNLLVRFKVIDSLNKIEIDMPSRRVKVNADKKMLDTLERLEVEYKLL